MKKMLMLVTLGALLMLVLSAPPVFAASKTEKVGYAVSGYIDGPMNWGDMSLAISGNIHQRIPDYTYQGYASYSIPFSISCTEVYRALKVNHAPISWPKHMHYFISAR